MTLPRSTETPHGSYLVRLATADDAATIAHHRASMFRDMKEADEQGASIIANTSEDHLAALIEAREYIGFLAAHEGEVVAGAGAWLRPLLPRPGRLQGSMEAYILNVYTEPGHRRRGLARLLMNTIIAWSQERRVARIVLHASQEGKSLYESLGFEISNEMRIVLDGS